MALDEEGQKKQDATIKVARDATRKEAKKLVQEDDKSMRKKYSDGAEAQASKPGKKGLNSQKK